MAYTAPCAPMQAGLVYETLAGEPGLYVQQIVITCREPLDIDRLREAWLCLARRHEALRTFFEVGEFAGQRLRVYDDALPEVVLLDWRELSGYERDRRWRELLQADREAGFVPNLPPLMRVALCRMGDEFIKVLWSYHHAILDGRSRLMLLRELFSIVRGDPEPPAPPSFSRFAKWANAQADDPPSRAFWSECLRGVLEATPAPGVRPEAPTGAEGRGSLSTRLDGSLSDRVRSLAAARNLTPATVLQGALALLLAQEAGRDDVLFLTTRSGRHSAPFDTSAMIGLLMVTSPVRLHVDWTCPASRWLQQVHDFNRAVRPFEHTPLSALQGLTGIPRPLPIAETLFSYENASMDTLLRQTDPSWERREVELVEELDYTVTLEARGDPEIHLRVLFDRARVSEAEAGRVLDRLQTLVRAIVAAPEAPVATILTLDPQRRRELAGEGVPALVAPLVPQRIARQITEGPDRVAVDHRSGRMTYRQLDKRAGAIAAACTRLALAPGGRAGVAMQRTPDMVAAVVGVHRTGAAYVPIDTRLPRRRLEYLLRDSEVSIVLTDRVSAPSLPEVPGAQRLLVEDIPPVGGGAAWVADVGAQDASHVIYTSGSTGQPKGVVIPHRAVAQLAAWSQTMFSDVEREGVLASTSLGFDLSVFEVLVTLALGGRIVLVDDVLALSDPDFAHRVSLVNSVPSAIGALLRTGALPPSVRTVALAGEALPQSLVDRLLTHGPVENVWNLYGPSEDTTYSTAHRCQAGARPLIGRPLPGTRAYIVDHHLVPVPEGVAGELVLTGEGLADGYLHRPELTAERFIELELDGARQRAYRTGDRVRWTAEGMLDYLGRIDDQVKIRGVRVEPGELTHALRDLPDVTDAAVVARGEGAERRLDAYVVGDDLYPQAMLAALRELLPEPLLPAAIRVLDALPLTPNGKLARDALPDPGQPVPTDASASTSFTPLQRALGEVWKEILDLKMFPGPADDFFALGGDSLSALELLTAIEEQFGRRLPVRTLVQETTLAAQARVIEAARTRSAAAALVRLRATGQRPPFVCVLPDHRGLVGLRDVLPATLVDQPVYAMQAIDPERPSWRTSSVEQIATACLRTLAGERPSGPYRLGGYSLGGLVAHEMACRLQSTGENVELVVMLDTLPPGAFRWPGRALAHRRMLKGQPWRARARSQAHLARTMTRSWMARTRGEMPLKVWPRGFDDPWDLAGADRIMRGYHPPVLRAPMVVLSTPMNAMRAGDPALGWRRHVVGPVTFQPLPGDHATILGTGEVRILAAALAEELAAADRRAAHAPGPGAVVGLDTLAS